MFFVIVGDLYFAYAIKEDDLGGRLYKSTALNEYLDLRSGGSYTNVTVNRSRPTSPQLLD